MAIAELIESDQFEQSGERLAKLPGRSAREHCVGREVAQQAGRDGEHIAQAVDRVGEGTGNHDANGSARATGRPISRDAPMSVPSVPMTESIVVFDGVCNLCNAAVDFIVRHDDDVRYRFAASQSPMGAALIEAAGLPRDETDTVVLVENGDYHVRSDAVLRIARGLGRPWSLLWPLIHLPRPLRDLGYRLVARLRTRIFGQRDTCRLPTPEERNRFL